MKGAVLFEKLATVFKHKISFSQSLSSKNTPTLKIRKKQTPYQYFPSTTAACHVLSQTLLFLKLKQSCATLLCKSSGFQMVGLQKSPGVPWKFLKPESYQIHNYTTSNEKKCGHFWIKRWTIMQTWRLCIEIETGYDLAAVKKYRVCSSIGWTYSSEHLTH